MKSRLTISLLAFLLASLVSCTKELSNETGHSTGPGGSNGNFYATIAGNPWNADSLQQVQVGSNGVVSISGLSKTGEEILMILPMLKIASYPLGGLTLSYASYTNLLASPAAIYASNASNASGSVTISSIDTVNHLVSGTFQFTLVDQANNATEAITQGAFVSIPYSGGVNQPPGSLADTLQATIGNNPFKSAQILTNDSLGQLLLAGISADGTQTLALLMPDNISPGSYPMDFGTGLYIGIYTISSAPSNPLVSQANGILTIIKNDAVAKRISGTFSFIGSPLSSGTPVAITNGYFSLNY